MNGGDANKQIYKLVLTGGPCGGKTTGQERLATFFEGLGWKVFLRFKFWKLFFKGFYCPRGCLNPFERPNSFPGIYSRTGLPIPKRFVVNNITA